MPKALLVDDDEGFVFGLAEAVKREGFEVRTAGTLQDARQALREHDPDALLIDLQLPDGSGLELLQTPEGRLPPGVIVISGNASVEIAVEALRLGAIDYLTKPVDFARVKMALANLARTRELTRQVGALRGELRGLGRFGSLVGGSPPMQAVYDMIAQVAPTEATVFVLGESGTGKELVAQTLHELSRRAKQAVRADQLRRHLAEPDRERAVRARARQLHGRRPQPPRATSSARTAARSSSTRSPRCRSSCR